MKQRKVPLRKDIVTGEMAPKKQLVRVVRNQDQEVSIDPTGKQSGRGAYISLDVKVAEQAKHEKTFDRVFGVKIDDQFYDDLIAYVDHQQARKELFDND
ncbi:nucleic-acid-binding protein implicated in transcription termination [Levilactobacillus senmaizukei DSM 21775 = NBRC 103853]|uniref:Nucleic-acid-binding protein implicated in transcription termination n=1 Tax=Levilactobacillus senmaizukei DSM 21775 = NBRC 103853 TaxID=1423803 RepID=A0A0R2DPQ8_9LACO|nr:YlxR family protein [Levilactobacillus senmaizukei]KRN02759.1 nucleic-acid-binding protein implicated in transcription termination [Levilactobacillus senmaizukei DSM 21775 = NBRC 103853]